MNKIAALPRPLLRARVGATALALLVGIGLASCGDDSGSSSSGTGTSQESGAAAAGGATGSVSVMNQVKFLNPELRVAAGTVVVFDNQDNQAHTATSDDNKTFDTDLLQPGAKKSVTFDKAGTFAYHCSLHPFMKAQIVVS